MKSTTAFVLVSIFVAVTLLVAAPSPIAAQSCSTTFRGSPLTNFKCDSIVSTDTVLFLAANQTYEDVDASAQESARLFGAFVSPACRTAALRLVCLGKFLKCTASATTGLTLYPPCRSVCETMVLECSAVAAKLGVSSLLPNCDQTSNATGPTVPIYPPDFSGQCVTGPEELVIPYSQADCPYPLQYDSEGTLADIEPNRGAARDVQAKVPVHGVVRRRVDRRLHPHLRPWVDQLHRRHLPPLVVAPQPQDPALPLQHHHLLRLLPVAGLVRRHVGAFFNMAGEDIMCTWDSPPQPIVMDNAGDNHGQGVACIIQGIVTYYCVLACVIWWFFVNVDCALQLFLNVRIERFRWLQPIYHLIGWGVPLIGLAFLLGFEKIGYENTFPVCQVYLDEHKSWWVMFFTLLGMFLMFPGIVFLIVLIVRRLASGQRSKRDLWAFSRLYVSLFIIWAFTIFVYAYRANVEDRREDVIQAVTDQVECSLLTGEECELETTFNHGLWFLSLIALTGLIPLVFATLGTTKVTWEFWVKLFRCSGEESPPKHIWSVISGRHLEDDDRGFELRQYDK